MSIYFVLMIDTNKIKKEITYFHVNIDIFSSIATTLYGYICHQLLFPIRSELAKSSKKRMNKVCDRTVFFTFLIYIIVMNVGYFTWVGDTESLVITNYT
jgi:amino acid permease